MSILTIPQIDEAVRSYFQRQLNKALIISLDLPDDPTVDIDAEVEGLRKNIAELTDQIKSKTFDLLTLADADEIVQANAPAQKVQPLDILDYTRRGVARARIERAKYLVKALSGDYSDNAPSDPLFSGMTPQDFVETGVIPEQLTLKAASGRFVEVKKSSREWVNKTELDYRRVLDLAVELIGGTKPVSQVSTDDVKAVRDTLSKLPRNIAKPKSSFGKSMATLIDENPSAMPISPQTQAKYFGMFKSFLLWLVAEEEIQKVPGPNVKVFGSAKTKSPGGRYPYSNEQLQRIFSSPLYLGCASPSRRAIAGHQVYRDGYYWIPLVALYSGMRLGEIVQLSVNDLKLDSEVPYFSISLAEGEGKHLKTSSSARRVPVHKMLIEMGLLGHLEAVKKQKKARIFDDIKPGKDGYSSHNFSKWWGRFAHSIEVHTPSTTFHSFRHAFIDALREAEVPDSVSNSLVGHADRSVHAGYGHGVSIQKLADHLNKVAYPIQHK